MSVIQYYNVDHDKLKDIAVNIAKNSKIGDVICLHGDLGVGKTCFSKYFIQSLVGDTQDVTSPSFPLLQIYQSGSVNIWHFDLYRLKEKEEIYEIGIEDALFSAISLIEWPSIAIDLLPSKRIDIHMKFAKNDDHRDVFVAYSA